jgi:hypothetical protein
VSKAKKSGRPDNANRRQAAEKVQQRRAEQARRDRRRRGLIVAASVVVVAAIGVGIGVGVSGGGSDDSNVSGVDLSGVRSYDNEAGHVSTAVKYPQTPPAGGDHNAVWLNCGIYDAPVTNENAVHDLEHGAVWITYRPDLPKAQVETLAQQVSGESYLTLSPYPDLPTPVVASAWNRQIQLTGVDDPRLAAFISKYKQSSDAPEPGAPCTGGVGTPAA